MTRLLVSVRDAEEARLALDAGVDLIDVKEPHRGSLGAADPEVVAAVARVVGQRVPLSVALGELADDVGQGVSKFALEGVTFAKWGLAGCAARSDWQDLWRAGLAPIRAEVAPVAVVYADWQAAGAPPPDEVLSMAVELGCAAVLLDTYHKDRGSLLELWEHSHVVSYVIAVQRHGMLAVVAGSLTPTTLPRVISCRPDYVAVRGAACSGSRRQRIDAARLEQLVALTRSKAMRCTL